jgi:hypothetical protein
MVETFGIKKMFAACIMQAFKDAKRNVRRGYACRDKDEAVKWFESKATDAFTFRHMCEFLGVDARGIRMRALGTVPK